MLKKTEVDKKNWEGAQKEGLLTGLMCPGIGPVGGPSRQGNESPKEGGGCEISPKFDPTPPKNPAQAPYRRISRNLRSVGASGSTRRQLPFLPLAVGVINVADVARVSLLAGLQVHSAPVFEFAHTLGLSRRSCASNGQGSS